MSDVDDLEIEYRPIKKIFIFEALKLPMEEFSKRTGLIARTRPVYLGWAEGIVFFYVPLSFESDVVVEEFMKGNMYWSNVTYTLMPEYEPFKKIGGIEIPIVDQTSNPYLKQVARWLKNRKE